MKASSWEVRIVFLLVLGLFGTFALHGTNLWFGLIGIGAGMFAITAQIFIVRLSVDNILYSIVGCMIGLLLGFLIMLVLQSGLTERERVAD